MLNPPEMIRSLSPFASFTDTPGSGRPTVPGRRSPAYGLLISIRFSLIPYRSRIVCPNRTRNSSNTCGESGADPDTNSHERANLARGLQRNLQQPDINRRDAE